MTRSNLSIKTTVHNIAEFEKYYKKNHPDFKGNVIDQVTFGVLRDKEVPDIDDVITLIRLENNTCDIETAEGILERYLESEEGQVEGVYGAFIHLIKDLSIDIKISKYVTEQLDELEKAQKRKAEMQSKISEMINGVFSAMQSLDLTSQLDNTKDIESNDQDEKIVSLNKEEQ